MFKSTYGTMYYVDDMKSAVQYYKSTLNLSPGYESPEWTEFPLGDHNICLHAKRTGQTYAGNGVLIMNGENVKDLYEKMRREGVQVFGLHQIHEGRWSFHLKDPQGNEFSIYGAP